MNGARTKLISYYGRRSFQSLRITMHTWPISSGNGFFPRVKVSGIHRWQVTATWSMENLGPCISNIVIFLSSAIATTTGTCSRINY